MSAYDNDPRVTNVGDGCYDVTCCAGVDTAPMGHVRLNGLLTFTVSVPGPETESQVFDDADEAIHSLIGDPQ
jgi:hypothetical protein